MNGPKSERPVGAGRNADQNTECMTSVSPRQARRKAPARGPAGAVLACGFFVSRVGLSQGELQALASFCRGPEIKQ